MRDSAAVAPLDEIERQTRPQTRQNIIWIASYPKSGNTWVRVFLHNLLRQVRGEGDEPQDINCISRYTGWEHNLRHYAHVLEKAPHTASIEEIAKARPHVQRRIAEAQAGPQLIKTHLCFGIDHGVPTIDLNSSLAAIYIVRNPLDVAVSYARHNTSSVDSVIANMACPGFVTPANPSHIAELTGSWSQHVASWLGLASRPVLLVRYEDMVTQPRKTFGSLARFLGLVPSDRQLQAAIRMSSFDELARQESERNFVEKPPRAEKFFRNGKVGNWRATLSKEQVQRVIGAHAPMMMRVSYLPSVAGVTTKVAGAD